MEDIRLLPVSIGTRAMHADLPADDDDKYWVRITASNAELDRHNSMMDPKTTLKNFEEDAKSVLGVALKDHHAWRSFGYGRSADAQLTDKNELLIDFFILKNMEYSGSGLYFTSSEQLIRAIENDLVNQASIGFFGAREVCNLCNLPIRKYSYWDWEPEREGQCTHKMGKKYEDKNGKMVPATYTVFDARLKEVSLVEFASNRKTSIDTEREFDELGRHIETLCRTTSKTFMEELIVTDQDWITKLREVLDIPNVRSTDEPDAVLETIETEVASLRKEIETQKDEIADLTADAADGKAYREARVDEAIKQGNRAYGDEFDEEYHREYYGDMPLEKLEEHIAQNQKKGDAALSAGRSTTDTHEPPPEKEKVGVRQRQRRMRRRK